MIDDVAGLAAALVIVLFVVGVYVSRIFDKE
jgi:hypothetical protein